MCMNVHPCEHACGGQRTVWYGSTSAIHFPGRFEYNGTVTVGMVAARQWAELEEVE